MVVTLHSLHVQILHANSAHLALVRECIGDFVKVILTGISYLKLFIHLIYTSFTIVVFIDVHGKSRVAALPRIFHPLN